MPLGEAIEYALAAGVSPTHEATANASAAPFPPFATPIVSAQRSDTINGAAGPAAHQLSQRELEVAALVARALTNRQIAEALVIAEGTVANHVKHILAKLALDSRVQIAAWAIERGLDHHPAP